MTRYRAWLCVLKTLCYRSCMTDVPLTCSVEDCERVTRTRKASLCNTHYFRQYRNGSPERLLREERRATLCRFSGCDRLLTDHGGWGWCRKHYIRWYKYGDPAIVKPPRHFRGDAVGYRGLHMRIVKARGKASEHVCSCGVQAQQWAYDHSDPEPKLSRLGSPYSLDVRRYDPLCRSCHGKRDWQYR